MKHLLFLLSFLFGLNACTTEEQTAINPDGNNISSDSLPAYDARLTNFEYPFAVKTFSFKSQKQDLEMAYMVVSPTREARETIVLMHGKNFNGAYWERTAKMFANLGFRVIIPDQIGFGKSNKPQNYQFTFQQLAHNTKMLLDELGVEKARVLGHSMGGMLATRFSLMYPETVSNLILLNPIGLEDWKLKVPYQSVSKWYEGELKKNYEGIRKYQQASYYDGDWKDEYDPWVNILAAWTRHEDYAKVAWNAALTYDMIFTQPVVYEFSELKMPTLLIIGTRDRTALGKGLVSEEVKKTMGNYDQLGETVRDLIPKADLVELNDIGHLPHIEDFERFEKAIRPYLVEN